MEEKNKQPITLSVTEAAEYQAYKREKHILEVMRHIQKSVLSAQKDNLKQTLATAVKYNCAAVKVLPTQLAYACAINENGKVKIDCIIGGDGQTFTKVKVYETKLARKQGAQEITLCLNESDVKNNRVNEIKKEIKKVCKAAKGAPVKVRLQENWGNETLLRLCRLSFEMGAKFVSVPYFEGCERLKNDLYAQLGIEITDVENLSIFKKMAGAGMQRIQTNCLSVIYEEWMKEAENVTVEQAATQAAELEKPKSQTEKKRAQEYRKLISQKQP